MVRWKPRFSNSLSLKLYCKKDLVGPPVWTFFDNIKMAATEPSPIYNITSAHQNYSTWPRPTHKWPLKKPCLVSFRVTFTEYQAWTINCDAFSYFLEITTWYENRFCWMFKCYRNHGLAKRNPRLRRNLYRKMSLQDYDEDNCYKSLWKNLSGSKSSIHVAFYGKSLAQCDAKINKVNTYESRARRK